MQLCLFIFYLARRSPDLLRFVPFELVCNLNMAQPLALKQLIQEHHAPLQVPLEDPGGATNAWRNPNLKWVRGGGERARQPERVICVMMTNVLPFSFLCDSRSVSTGDELCDCDIKYNEIVSSLGIQLPHLKNALM